jgi:hypothetical protein
VPTEPEAEGAHRSETPCFGQKSTTPRGEAPGLRLQAEEEEEDDPRPPVRDGGRRQTHPKGEKVTGLAALQEEGGKRGEGGRRGRGGAAETSLSRVTVMPGGDAGGRRRADDAEDQNSQGKDWGSEPLTQSQSNAGIFLFQTIIWPLLESITFAQICKRPFFLCTPTGKCQNIILSTQM